MWQNTQLLRSDVCGGVWGFLLLCATVLQNYAKAISGDCARSV